MLFSDKCFNTTTRIIHSCGTRKDIIQSDANSPKNSSYASNAPEFKKDGDRDSVKKNSDKLLYKHCVFKYMGNRLSIEKERLSNKLNKQLIHIRDEADRQDYATKMYQDGGGMGICIVCCTMVSYLQDLVTKMNGNKRPKRVHTCGNPVVRTSWTRVKEFLDN
jgi:hypothetical protein